MSKIPKNTKVNTIIYTLSDPITNEVRYIGKTVKSLKSRLADHLYERKNKFNLLNHKINWVMSLKKRGLSPVITEIDNCYWDESQALEIYWISQFKTWGFRLTNSSDGGEGNLGLKQSDKMKLILKKSNSIKVNKYGLDGNFICSYDSIKEASLDTKAQHSKIVACCKGKRNKAGKFMWKYTSDNIAFINPDVLIKQKISEETKLKMSVYWKNKLKKDLYVYDIKSNYIGHWVNITDCASDLNICKTNIISLIKGNINPQKYIILREENKDKVKEIIENKIKYMNEVKKFLIEINPRIGGRR